MANKRLFYFPAARTDVGTMPAYYDELPAADAADAIKWGGIDVTDDVYASAAYERQLAYTNECGS